jgi:hypothetical protein
LIRTRTALAELRAEHDWSVIDQSLPPVAAAKAGINRIPT